MSDLPADAFQSAPQDEEGGAVQTTLADFPGQLKDWLGGVADQHQDWAQNAVTWVNDFITRRDIADGAQAQADQYVSDIRSFGDGLGAIVRADPTATNMALGLTALTVPAMVNDHPFIPDDQRGDVAHQLAGDIGKSIARNSVLAWAQRDPDTAHAELKRLGGLFAPEEQVALGDHVDLLGTAIQADNDAMQIQQANDRANEAHRRSAMYQDELIRPDGSIQFNPSWMRRVINDPVVTDPQDVKRLMDYQAKLRQYAQKDILKQLPTKGSAIFDYLQAARDGNYNALADAVNRDELAPWHAQDLRMLHNDPRSLDYIEKHVQEAKRALAGPDGELSAANGKIMDTVVNDTLNGYRKLGAGAFDPNDPNYLGGVRKGFGQTEMERRIAVEQKAQRLEDIFARKEKLAQQVQAARGARSAAEFEVRQQLEAKRKEEADFARQRAREEAATARQQRIELRDEARGQLAQNAANVAQVRLQQRDEERAIRLGNENAREASRGGGRQQPSGVDTFRKFAALRRRPAGA